MAFTPTLFPAKNTKLPFLKYSILTISLLFVIPGVFATPTNVCGVINESIEINESFSANGTCFTVNASNIVIDGKGSVITGNKTGYAVNITGFHNITVKNFNGLNNFTTGIFISSGENSTIHNNAIRGAIASNAHGINVILSSHGNNLSYNNITVFSASIGLRISGSNDLTVSSNNVTTSSTNAYAIHFISSNNSAISFNTLTTSGTSGHGIFTQTSTNNTLTSNTIKTSGLAGSGIDLETSTESTVQYNMINVTGTQNAYGVYIESSSDNNTVFSNTIETSNSFNFDDGVRVENSDNANVTNNTIDILTQGIGIRFDTTTGGTANSNTINVSGSGAWGISTISTTNAVISSNTVATSGSNGRGIVLHSGTADTNVTSNLVSTSHTSTAYGINFINADNNTIEGNEINATGVEEIYIDNLSAGNIFIHNILLGTANFSSDSILGVSIDINSTPPANPGKSNLSAYLEINNVSSDGYVDFNLSYSFADIIDIVENTIGLHRYNETSGNWTLVGSSSVDIINHVVSSGNLTSFSLFAPFGDNGTTFSGYTYFTNGTGVDEVNVTVQAVAFWDHIGVHEYSVLSNASGYWQISVPDSILGNASHRFRFIARHQNSNGNVDYVSSETGAYSYSTWQNETDFNNTILYLKEAATINITALNATGVATFNYQVSDQISDLFHVKDSFGSPDVGNALVYVPADRNYSVRIQPTTGDPAVFWHLTDLSNNTLYGNPRLVNVSFNVTTVQKRVSGRVNLSNGTGTGFDTLNSVLFEVAGDGNVIYSQRLNYNISKHYGGTDIYNAPSGIFNISIQATPMNSSIVVFMVAKIGSIYYGGFKTITAAYDQADIENLDFILYELLGNPVNISVDIIDTGGSTVNITAPHQTFNFINSSGDLQTSAQGYLRLDVNYSDLDNQSAFGWWPSLQQGFFQLPVLPHVIDTMVFFTTSHAPIETSISAAELNASEVNITLTQWEMTAINGTEHASVQAVWYRSSPSCDVPNPPNSCLFINGIGVEDIDQFGDTAAVIAGGYPSLRIIKGNVTIHYKNVDILASLSPNAVFDDVADSTTTGSTIEEVWRFGSAGPKIYDEVLIGIPYDDSQLNESNDINVSFPLLYDDNWNIIWNTSLNGTNVTLLEYTDFNGSWFNGTMICSTTNSTADCFINTTPNVIWIRIPHFSGVGPSISGQFIGTPPSGSPPADDTGSGGGGGVLSIPKKTHIFPVVSKNNSVTLIVNESSISVSEITFSPMKDESFVTLTVSQLSAKPSYVDPDPSGKVYSWIEIELTKFVPSEINNAVIKFSVNKTWLSDNGFSQVDVILLRFADGQWEELPTTVYKQDSGAAYYTASTPGFSVFVISAEKAALEEGMVLECVNGSLRCSGNILEECTLNTWKLKETCEFGCSNNACLDAGVDKQPNQEIQTLSDIPPLFLDVLAGIIVLVLIIALFIGVTWHRHQKTSKKNHK